MVSIDLEKANDRIPSQELYSVRLVNVQECQDASEEWRRHNGQFWIGGGTASGLCAESLPFQHCF